jgi:hypothetical protein
MWFRIENNGGSCEHDNEPSDSIGGEEFNYMGDYKILKDCAPKSQEF